MAISPLSNSRKGLLPSHQTIYYYTKSNEYTFNNIWQEYSPSTNVDQILQQRSRDDFGKSTYKRDASGQIGYKWQQERCPPWRCMGYPLFESQGERENRVSDTEATSTIGENHNLATNPGDTVLDPFCGSGTTLVAAAMLGRNGIGIDIAKDAVMLTRQRLRNPVKSESRLFTEGREAYRNADESLLSLLHGLEYVPVQRNKGIDAMLKKGIGDAPVPIRIQRDSETILEAARKLYKASRNKGVKVMFLVATKNDECQELFSDLPEGVVVVKSPGASVSEHIGKTQVNL